MLKDKKCPYCGTMNKGPDLKESDGLYVCSNCERVVDTKKDEPQTDNEEKTNKEGAGAPSFSMYRSPCTFSCGNRSSTATCQ